jgi:chromosome segregation ATPase
MGNASVINASCYKKNSLDSGGDGNINLSGIVEATVIQNEATKKSKEGKTKKTLTKPNTSSKSKDNLQKEVDNLQNQLKERTDRITELELTIKNNNNNNLEEKVRIEKKRSELENQLNSKNLNILEVEEKYTATQLLVNKSAKGFEALGIVIQYYIEQIETVTKQLSDAFEEKNQLDLHNQELSRDNEIVKSELQEIMTRLDAEKSRCETVQHDLETLAASHEVEINALTDRQQQEQDKLKSSLKIEKDNGIVKVKEEHQTEIERLNT